MTTIIMKSGTAGPEPEVKRILGSLVPQPHQYDFILPNGGKDAYILLWRLIGAHLNSEELYVGTEQYVTRTKRRIFEPVAYQLQQLGWRCKLRMVTSRSKKVRKVFMHLQPSEREATYKNDWQIAPTPEQMRLLQQPNNEDLTRAVWFFVQSIAEGHNVLDLGRVDRLHLWMTDQSLSQAKDIVLSRGWSAYALRSKATKQVPYVRMCLKLVPKYVEGFNSMFGAQ